MLLAVRLRDDVELSWLRSGPGRIVRVVDAAPPGGPSHGRSSVTPREASAIVELGLGDAVVWELDRIDDALEDWLAAG